MTWKPLTVPVNCNLYFLKNNGPDMLYICSDPTDATTVDEIQPGFYEALLAQVDAIPAQPRLPRFTAGTVLYYAKGTGPVLGKFWL